ncbi:hypothetical protein Q7P35_011588 [Cladosporium inversicolor]
MLSECEYPTQQATHMKALEHYENMGWLTVHTCVHFSARGRRDAVHDFTFTNAPYVAICIHHHLRATPNQVLFAKMNGPVLITPTLHVEVQLSRSPAGTTEAHAATRKLDGFRDIEDSDSILAVHIADYTGPHVATGYYSLADTKLDVQTYVLRSEQDTGKRRNIKRDSEGEDAQARIIGLPNIVLNEDWDSLVFDDGLPSRLLRYLVRMVAMMGKPGLNLATFNWNKICLLHGPPGSGKSTLCRALAQKASYEHNCGTFKSTLVEVNANAMLSKYFGESGKLIESTFDQVEAMAKDRSKLVVVVIDEVETIASSRQRVSSSGECNDGLRATNQLLTALDRFRSLTNILVCCTSNLIEAIGPTLQDPAFLDRVDIKQYVPSPSSAAVYNIFRSCLNELARTKLLSPTVISTNDDPIGFPSLSAQLLPQPTAQSSPPARKRRRTARHLSPPPTKKSEAYIDISVTSSPLKEPAKDEISAIPTLAATLMSQCQDTSSPGQRIWLLARKCQGLHLSGRTLRRLPVLGLAMYTWGGEVGMEEAVGALERAVEEEVVASNVEA